MPVADAHPHLLPGLRHATRPVCTDARPAMASATVQLLLRGVHSHGTVRRARPVVQFRWPDGATAPHSVPPLHIIYIRSTVLHLVGTPQPPRHLTPHSGRNRPHADLTDFSGSATHANATGRYLIINALRPVLQQNLLSYHITKLFFVDYQ